jgi:hypothetical protein
MVIGRFSNEANIARRTEDFTTSKPELYHLSNDLGEQHDIAETHPDKVKDLLGRYQKLASQAVPPKAAAKSKGFRVPRVWGETE